MELQLNKLQKEIQKAAKEFAKGEFDKDLAWDLDKRAEFPEKILEKAAALGFIGSHFPEKYDGGDMGVLENALVAEEFCRKDSTLGCALMLAGFGAECVMRFASEGLKETFLPKVIAGEVLSCAAFAETGIDYGDSHMNTTAIKHGDEWIVNGEKTFVVNGGKAGFYCLLSQTDPNKKQPDGISMILVEGDRQGVSSIHVRNNLGMRMTTISDLNFEDVRVPVSNLLGKEGRGMKQAAAFLCESRILTAAIALGIAQGAFDRALDYAKQREQFKKKIVAFQVTQHKLADMATKIECARSMTYGAAMNFDTGQHDFKLSSMAKLVACQAALEVAGEAVQLMGGYGYTTEYEVERFFRDAKWTEAFGGNTRLLKDAIAGEVIGKIR